jgi:5'-nucleotidase
MQVSESLEISYIRSGDTLSVETVKIKGDPISLDRQYRLVINSFMFAGGDGFDIFAKGQNAIVLGRDIDLLQQSFKANLKKILASQQFLQPRVVLR